MGISSGINLYLFVKNDSVNKSDPFGLFCIFTEELTVLMNVGVGKAGIAAALAKYAMYVSQNSGLPGQHNGPMDAFRHCYWSCVMSRNIGPFDALKVGNIHEDCDKRNICEEKEMDLHNNAVGVILSLEMNKASCEEICFFGYYWNILKHIKNYD